MTVYGRVRNKMAERMMNAPVTHKHIIPVIRSVAVCYLRQVLSTFWKTTDHPPQADVAQNQLV